MRYSLDLLLKTVSRSDAPLRSCLLLVSGMAALGKIFK